MVIIKVKFTVNCMGFTVGGHGSSFEAEVKDLNFKTNKEREEYIESCISNYILENIEFEYEYTQ